MRRVILVFAGGFCGTLARYLLSAPLLALAQRILPGGASFPYDILAINLTGALALGLLYGLVERGAAISPDVRLTLGTGFLGAYTTFSSFVVGGDKLVASGNPNAGTLYLLGSIVLGVGAAHAGYLLAGLLSQSDHIARPISRPISWPISWPISRRLVRRASGRRTAPSALPRFTPPAARFWRRQSNREGTRRFWRDPLSRGSSPQLRQGSQSGSLAEQHHDLADSAESFPGSRRR